jgi:hypothetical protein
VDSLGDLRDAVERARHLVGASARRYTPLLDVLPPKRYVPAQASPGDLGGWLDGLKSLLRERTYTLAPWSIRFRG